MLSSKYVNCEEEEYSDKEHRFNIIIFISNTHKTAVTVCSNFSVNDTGFWWRGKTEYLRSEVPFKMNIYFVGCAVSSAQLPCPKLGWSPVQFWVQFKMLNAMDRVCMAVALGYFQICLQYS